MRTKTETYTVYKFSELSEKAQQKVLDHFADWAMQDCEFHASCVCEDAIEIASHFGLKIDPKSWSYDISYCHGYPYLTFQGTYGYIAGCFNAVKSVAPVDHALHAIIERLVQLQKKNSYQLSANISHYNFEREFSISADRKDYKDVSESVENELKEIISDYGNWILKNLTKELEYQCSKPAILECIEINDHEFYEDGSLA